MSSRGVVRLMDMLGEREVSYWWAQGTFYTTPLIRKTFIVTSADLKGHPQRGAAAAGGAGAPQRGAAEDRGV